MKPELERRLARLQTATQAPAVSGGDDLLDTARRVAWLIHGAEHGIGDDATQKWGFWFAYQLGFLTDRPAEAFPDPGVDIREV